MVIIHKEVTDFHNCLIVAFYEALKEIVFYPLHSASSNIKAPSDIGVWHIKRKTNE